MFRSNVPSSRDQAELLVERERAEREAKRAEAS